MKLQFALTALALATVATLAATPATQPSISGDYVEVRTCNIFAGGCISNGEMGLTGKEAILVWSVRQGAWDGTKLDGLKVVLVTTAQTTLGDQQAAPQSGKAVFILDDRANAAQQKALTEMARSLAGQLGAEIVAVKKAPIEVTSGPASEPGMATVRAGELVEIQTYPAEGRPTACGGHAEIVYPPLTKINNPHVAFAQSAAYRGDHLNGQWEITGVFAAFVGTFSR